MVDVCLVCLAVGDRQSNLGIPDTTKCRARTRSSHIQAQGRTRRQTAAQISQTHMVSTLTHERAGRVGTGEMMERGTPKGAKKCVARLQIIGCC
jgi:hypothetical protein